LPVIFVVLNDHAYGMIKHAHRLAGTEPVDFAIPPVDFCQMAKAAGADAYTIRHPDDFEQLDYLALCSRNGPTVLDVSIDPEEVPPLGMV
jgi:acetolactate synthase-1/2/3 large subunit